MVTKRVYNLTGTSLLTQGLIGASILGILPYKWNTKDNQVEWKNNRRTKTIFLLQFWLYNAYVFYVLCIFLQALFLTKPEADNVDAVRALKSKRVALQYILSTYGGVLVIQWSTYTCYGKHHVFFNNFLQLGAEFLRKYEVGNELGKKPFSKPGFIKLGRLIKFAGCAVVTLNLLTNIRKPDLPHLITSLVPRVTNVRRSNLSPLIALQLYIWATQWVTLFAFMTQITMYPYWIKRELNMLNKTTISLNGRLFADDFIMGYRKLQVLQSQANSLYSRVILQVEIVSIVAAVAGIYTAIKADFAVGIRSLIFAILVLIMLLSYFIQLSEINEVSTKVISSWKRAYCPKEMSKLLPKFLDSAVPIRMQVGSFFYADRSIVLTILAIIINNSASLLLTE